MAVIGDSPIGAGISAAANSITTLASRILGNAVNLSIAAMKKAQALAKTIWEKTAKFRSFMQKTFQFAKKYSQKFVQFSKFMAMMWKMMPVVIVFTGIILVFTNSLYYVTLAIAYTAISFIQIIFIILSYPPFIHIVFFLFYFMIVDGIPFILISLMWISVLVLIAILCSVLALVNEVTDNGVSKVMLCDNKPSAWYETPNYQLGNRYMRAIMCSKPCSNGYAPANGDVASHFCEKLPANTPSYCPQAGVMRLYTGIAKAEPMVYGEYPISGNMTYLSKNPKAREDILLAHFMNRVKYLERCGNKTNKFNMRKYDAVTKSICANLDVLQDRMAPKDFIRLTQTCNQSFCDAGSSYPFCTTMAVASSFDLAELFKKIIYALIAIIVFCLALMTILHEVSKKD